MALFLVTSVCDEGGPLLGFEWWGGESRLAVAKDMFADPVKWKVALRPTELWWDLTYYPYKYGQSQDFGRSSDWVRPAGFWLRTCLPRCDPYDNCVGGVGMYQQPAPGRCRIAVVG